MPIQTEEEAVTSTLGSGAAVVKPTSQHLKSHAIVEHTWELAKLWGLIRDNLDYSRLSIAAAMTSQVRAGDVVWIPSRPYIVWWVVGGPEAQAHDVELILARGAYATVIDLARLLL